MQQEIRFSLVEVHVSPWEAHVSRALLESEGIPAFLGTEHHVGANWPMSLMLGGVRVLVPSEQADAAREVLALRDEGVLQGVLSELWPAELRACTRCGSTEVRERADWSAVVLAVLLMFFFKATFPPARREWCAACAAPRPFE